MEDLDIIENAQNSLPNESLFPVKLLISEQITSQCKRMMFQILRADDKMTDRAKKLLPSKTYGYKAGQ